MRAQEIERRREGLHKVDLNKLYDACNTRWFGGKLPPSNKLTIRWIRNEDLKRMDRFMPEGAHWNARRKEINIRLAAHANGRYRLLCTMVHEMVHVYVTYLGGGDDYVALRRGGRPHRHHGEVFGREARRINKDYPVFGVRELNYGLPRYHPERLHWLLGKLVDSETIRKRRAEWRRQEAEWKRQCELDAPRLEAERQARIERTRIAEEAEAQAKRAKRAAAFKERMGRRTAAQKIEALRKQLLNPKTPRQFVPSIDAKLRVLEQQLETSGGN